jgi:hypothetical protein
VGEVHPSNGESLRTTFDIEQNLLIQFSAWKDPAFGKISHNRAPYRPKKTALKYLINTSKIQPSCQGSINLRPLEYCGAKCSLFVEMSIKATQGLMKQLANSLAGEVHFLADFF